MLTSTDPLGRQTSYLYNGRGQNTRITSPDPDSAGPLTPSVTNFAYDLAGNLTTVTDPLSRTTTMVYDAQNRVTEQRLPTIASGTPTTRYGYDLAGQLTSITDPVNNITGYGYDNAGRVKQVNHPVGGSTLYVYNAADEVTRITDRNGRHRDFTYNDLGLPTTEKWLNGSSEVRTISWTYDDAGRVKTASDLDSHYAYTYDLGDFVRKVDNSASPGVPDVVLEYAYDYAGNRTSLVDSLGHSITYDYADHRLSQIALLAGTATVAQVDFAYDSIGRLTTQSRLAGTELPIQTTFVYDDLDRLKEIKHTRQTETPTTLSQFNYTFDAASQITQYVGPEGTLNYTYDNTGQLTGVSGARTESYSFDVNGNRTMTGYSTTTGNRLTSDGVYNYTYDNEGNTLTKTRISNNEQTTFTWDHRNRQTKAELRSSPGGTVIKQQDNTYDVNDRRISVLEDADGSGPAAALRRWTVYDGDNPYADFDAAGGLTKRYLYGPAIDWLFARYGADENGDWYLTDHLGSVRQVVDTDGTVLDAITYDSFGRILVETSTANGDRFKFTAREWDALFGNYFYRARYYSADAGRFLSGDPIGFAGGDTNLYRYVHNRPTNAIDPSGLEDIYVRGSEVYWVIESPGAWWQSWDPDVREVHIGSITSGNNVRLKPEFGGGTIPLPWLEGIAEEFWGTDSMMSSRDPETLRIDQLSPDQQEARIRSAIQHGAWVRERRQDRAGPGVREWTEADQRDAERVERLRLQWRISEWIVLEGGWMLALAPLGGRGGLGRPGTCAPGPSRIYSGRIFDRMAEDVRPNNAPGPMHNFPQSFDAFIFQGNRQVISPNYILYTQRGWVNGRPGTYEIGVRTSGSGQNEVITHRFFRPD